MNPAAWFGACQVLWLATVWRTRFCRWIKLARRLFTPRPCKSARELNLENQWRSWGSALGQAAKVAVVVERSRLLYKLQNLKHAFSSFAVQLAELHCQAGTRI